MRMIRMSLSDAARQELQQMSRQAVGRVALRAHMVLLSARGYRVPQIAQIHDVSEDVVRLWLHRYQEEGAAGLAGEPRSPGTRKRASRRSARATHAPSGPWRP